jgi:hypothetical protein
MAIKAICWKCRLESGHPLKKHSFGSQEILNISSHEHLNTLLGKKTSPRTTDYYLCYTILFLLCIFVEIGYAYAISDIIYFVIWRSEFAMKLHVGTLLVGSFNISPQTNAAPYIVLNKFRFSGIKSIWWRKFVDFSWMLFKAGISGKLQAKFYCWVSRNLSSLRGFHRFPLILYLMSFYCTQMFPFAGI